MRRRGRWRLPETACQPGAAAACWSTGPRAVCFGLMRHTGTVVGWRWGVGGGRDGAVVPRAVSTERRVFFPGRVRPRAAWRSRLGLGFERPARGTGTMLGLSVDSCVVSAEVGDRPDGSKASIHGEPDAGLLCLGFCCCCCSVSIWIEFSWDGEGLVAGGHVGALGPERR